MPDIPASGPPSSPFLKGLPDSLHDGLFAVNPEGVVVLWNRTLDRQVAPADRVLGQPLPSVLPLITDPMRSTDFGALILEGAIGRGESPHVEAYPRRGPDGIVRLFDVKIGPVRGRDGACLGAFCLFKDVTEFHRKAETDLRDARTSSLASFGASIAHEIRNPLNSIALNLELLREGIGGLQCEERSELIEESGAILEEIENLNRLVGNLLRFAQDPAPSLREGDASGAVLRALQLLAGEARKHSVRVIRDLSPLPGVRLDEDMLSRAVYNIALNAIQAMPGGGTLWVRTEAHPHSASIKIVDTGPGIAPEEREKIFGLFYGHRAGGTGIGLPIAHRIVAGHGGRITVGDGPKGGAVFQIHLPWAAR